MRKQSLRRRLSLTIAAVVLLTVSIISILANVSINRKFKDYIEVQQSQKTDELISSLSQQYNPDTEDWNTDFIHVLGMYALYDGYIIKVYDNQGTGIWDAEKHDMSLCNQVMADISLRMKEKYPRMNGEFTAHTYELMQGGEKVGSASLNYYGPFFLSENDFQFLRALNTILLSAGIVSLVLAVMIGWRLAKRISEPLSKAVTISREISEGNYEIGFDKDTNIKELDGLTQAITNLAGSLKEQEGLRKRLTADVAHELRTPLTTVSTHLEAMIEGVWEPTKERLSSCQEEVKRISNLVKDLEKLARVESDNLKLNKTSMDLYELVKTVSRTCEAEIYHQNLKVTIEGEPLMITADRDRISQVILNLLLNAVKYTPEHGNIRMEVSKVHDHAEFIIEDTGSGIEEKELPFVFERFYRADKSRNRKSGGAGLGLAIVKSIVTAHGGRVEVKSTVGKGSEFKVILPIL